MPMTTSVIDEMIWLEQVGWFCVSLHNGVYVYRNSEMENLEILCILRCNTKHEKNTLILMSRNSGRGLNYLTGRKAHLAAQSRRSNY